MSNSDILKVVQAHMDGKKIQIRKMSSHQGFRDGKWYDVENPRWDFDSCDYRVSPEPRKPREWVILASTLDCNGRPMTYQDSGVIRVREIIDVIE